MWTQEEMQLQVYQTNSADVEKSRRNHLKQFKLNPKVNVRHFLITPSVTFSMVETQKAPENHTQKTKNKNKSQTQNDFWQASKDFGRIFFDWWDKTGTFRLQSHQLCLFFFNHYLGRVSTNSLTTVHPTFSCFSTNGVALELLITGTCSAKKTFCSCKATNSQTDLKPTKNTKHKPENLVMNWFVTFKCDHFILMHAQ